MGCGASRVHPDQAALALSYAAERAAAEKAAAEKAVAEKAAAELQVAVLMADAAAAYQHTVGRATRELTGAALSFGQQLEMTKPMLVMPFGVFKAQGRIMKSTKAWRDAALAAGSLVEHEEGSGQIVIFISHTWWDRAFTDATNDPNDPYDVGAPDLQRDYPDEQRQGKFRVEDEMGSRSMRWSPTSAPRTSSGASSARACSGCSSRRGSRRRR